MGATERGAPDGQRSGSRLHTVGRLACVLPIVALGACGNPMPPYPTGIHNADPGVRIRSIKMAGDRQDRATLPLLVERLEDEDEAVRLFAIIAIEKITGTRLGYEYRKPAVERARAVKRWRQYLQQETTPAASPVTSSAGPGAS